jgi:hypothetical protein
MSYRYMERDERKLRHDIRGAFPSLMLSTEVLRGALPPEDRDMFLQSVVKSCQTLDELIGVFAPVEESES